jgi:glycosyltransferase involved in cell wall biosynthesis
MLLDVMASVRQAEPETEVCLVAGGDGPLLRRATDLGIRVVLVPFPAALRTVGDSQHKDRSRPAAALALASRGVSALWSLRRFRRRLRQALDELKPDVIHSNGIKTHLLTALTARSNQTVVWHVHDFLGPRPLAAKLLRWASRRATGALAISRAVATDAARVLAGLPIDLVYNAIDVTEFSPGPGDGNELDRLAGLPPAGEDVVRVGLVAAYARWKGQDVFLHAAARVLREQPGRPIRFFVVGGPIYHTRGSQFSEAELRTLAAKIGLGDRVGFVGFQEDVAPVFRALDVVVHASTQPEPFGRTIVEAMACGRPVIVSNAGGASELFTHDHDAVGVPPGDAAALAAAVGRLLGDSCTRRRLGENARRSAVAKFSRARLGPQVLAAYDRFRKSKAR